MAAESTAAVLVLAAGTAAASFIAGASSTPGPEAVEQIAINAQAVAKMSEESVFWYSLGGGIGGAFVAVAFGLYKGTTQQIAMRFLGSGLVGALATPAVIAWAEYPTSITWILPASAVIGMMAYGIVMAVSPIVFEWAPGKFKKWLGLGSANAKTEPIKP